jgi:hypothetical protein
MDISLIEGWIHTCHVRNTLKETSDLSLHNLTR